MREPIAVLGFDLSESLSLALRPYMRFLFVRPEVFPLGDLSTPKIRLSSDSASRQTPLPLANPSHCRADSGLSPYRTCAHRAHQKKSPESFRFREFWYKCGKLTLAELGRATGGFQTVLLLAKNEKPVGIPYFFGCPNSG